VFEENRQYTALQQYTAWAWKQ